MTNAGGPSPTEQLAGVSKGQNFALTTHSPKTVSFRKKPENAAFGNKGGGAGGGSMGITKLELPTPSVPSDADDGKDACHDDEDAPSPESAARGRLKSQPNSESTSGWKPISSCLAADGNRFRLNPQSAGNRQSKGLQVREGSNLESAGDQRRTGHQVLKGPAMCSPSRRGRRPKSAAPSRRG
jgi:hypothetical protein